MSALDAALLAAHAAKDTASLITLYSQAAQAAKTEDAAAFYLTHAYVFALEAGDARAPDLHKQLIKTGRDAPLAPAPQPYR